MGFGETDIEFLGRRDAARGIVTNLPRGHGLADAFMASSLNNPVPDWKRWPIPVVSFGYRTRLKDNGYIRQVDTQRADETGRQRQQ
jgi:hypothetical protein